MDPKELFNRCLHQASLVFEHLTPADYEKPTPDTEWNVHDLANHMLDELSWIPDMVEGRTIREVGDTFSGDLLKDNPVKNWKEAADLALSSVTKADLDETAHLSYADVPNSTYISDVSTDLYIHSWDLAAALGIDRSLDDTTSQAVYEYALPHSQLREASGLFSAPLETSDEADLQTKLLALYGRDADWKA